MDKAHITTDKQLATMERKLKAIYSKANKDVGKKLKEYLAKQEEKGNALLEAVKGAKSPEERKKAEEAYNSFLLNKTLHSEHFKALSEQYANELLRVNETAADYINGRMPDVYSLNYNETGKGIAGEVKGYSFEMVDASTVKSLATKDETLLPYKTVNGKKDVRWNTKQVNSEIMQGILQGESIPDISKRLTHVTEMNLTSAIRNARTATTSAENRGRMDSYHRAQEMGVQIVKVWMATNDQRTREEHLELDGQEREIDEPFENAFGEIMYPGDPDADPANVYNCRCTLVTRVVGFNGVEMEVEEDAEEVEEVGIEQLRSIAENSEDKYDFWTSLDEDQQAVFKASGMNLTDAFEMLHAGGEKSEWKAPNPGGPASFAIKHNFSNEKTEFNVIKAKSDGWMADATSAGIINLREGGLGDNWEFIITHEAGHQLANFSDELQQIIITNPGNVLGRYNVKKMAFDGIYGEYNPEEAFATGVSNYIRHPEKMKEKYTEAYEAIDALFKASPSARSFVEKIIKDYERSFVK